MRWARAMFHAGVLATSFVVLAWMLTPALGVGSGVVGVVAACLLAPWLAAQRVRLGATLTAMTLGAVASWGLSQTLTTHVGIAAALGPWETVEWAQVPLWGGLAFCVTVVLRLLALRWRPALALEGTAVVVAVAATVAAHRDGMIARPLNISDWFWTRGVDPVVAFLALGVAAAVLLAAVLAQHRRLGTTAAQLVLVLLLGVGLARHLHSQEEDLRAQGGGGPKGDAEKDNEERQRQAAGNSGTPHGGGGTLRDDVPPPKQGQGNRPVAVVVFHRAATPINGIFYFRHTAFSQFNGVRLVQSTRADVEAHLRQPFPQDPVDLLANAPPTPTARTEVATSVALLTDHESVFMLTDAVQLGPLLNPDPARFRRAYQVVSSVLTAAPELFLNAAAGEPHWTPEVWSHYTLTPKDPRYGELAQRLAKVLKPQFRRSPLALALAIKQHLETTSIYSFGKRHDEAADPTASFLFSPDRRGYCVHLAHSTALLLRALKMPARVSAGYAVPAERLGEGSSLLIKNENAHAWAEVYLRGVGWVPVEVTPEKSEVETNPFAEQDLQQLLGEMARKEPGALATAATPFPWKTGWDKFQRAVGWTLALLLALSYFLKVYRLWAPRWFQSQRSRTAYRAALDRLSAVGVRRHHGESRERFAARVAALAPSFGPLTHVHLAVAFGSQTPVGLRVVPNSQAVGGEVRRATPLWRWALGVAHPLSWLHSR